MYTIEFTDLHGRKYTNGARYAERPLELVRYYRRCHVVEGRITNVIPGGGVARHVCIVPV